jgi:putative endonuclease
MAQHNETGHWGEELACEKLITDGYAICQRNFRIGHYELDIIAMKGNRIVFVEVKTRTNFNSDPIEAIDNKKILRMVRAANTYVTTFDIPHEVQFDIITIVGTPDNYTLEHIPDAFMAPLTTR